MLLLTGTGPYAYRLEEEAAQVRRGELGTVLLSQRRVSKFLREVGALEDPRLRGKALTANKSGLLTLWTRMLSSLWLTLGTARRSTTNPLGPRFRRVHRFPSRDRGGGCRLWA
ncbi:hypothetical protein ACQX06_08875 [Corynebacterium diphtheriae]